MPQTINVYVGRSSDGQAVYEELPVARTASGEYRLLSSPGLALGLARDDHIRYDPEDGRFEVVRRGGNVCVQVYIRPSMAHAADELIRSVAIKLDGMLDGRTGKQVVFSIPISKGFDAIEGLFNQFTTSNDGAEWYFGNVYDEKDGVTPLNWWLNLDDTPTKSRRS